MRKITRAKIDENRSETVVGHIIIVTQHSIIRIIIKHFPYSEKGNLRAKEPFSRKIHTDGGRHPLRQAKMLVNCASEMMAFTNIKECTHKCMLMLVSIR